MLLDDEDKHCQINDVPSKIYRRFRGSVWFTLTVSHIQNESAAEKHPKEHHVADDLEYLE